MNRLRGQLQHYAWGSYTALAQLQGRLPSGRPEAEYWLGTHPSLPSQAEYLSRWSPLDTLIREQPHRWLGDDAVRRFGLRLPFLVKLLAADHPLSLQVHPDAGRAATRFSQGHPGYADGGHKPELLVAISPFEVLCGFREPCAAAETVRCLGVRELAWLPDLLATGGIEPAVRRILKMQSGEVRRAALSAAKRSPLLAGLSARYPADPATLIALLLNHFTLQPGEAVWMPAGNLHAYLQGVGLEVMAASDNVLRVGLTAKQVDVGEALAVTKFEPLPEPVFSAVTHSAGLRCWQVPVPDFALWEADLDVAGGKAQVPAAGPVIIVSLDEVLVRDEEAKVHLAAGEAAVGRAGGGPVEIQGTGKVFLATTGV